MPETSPLIIIGTGLAGYMFAKEWRKLDQATPLTIITRCHGDYYSKPLLSTALKNQKLAHDLPMNNVAEMAEQLDAQIIINCEVTKIDTVNQIVHAEDAEHPYRRLVMAVGSQPIHIAWEGNAVEQLHSINDLSAYGKFREQLQLSSKVVIIGSGLVGCEFANDLIQSGYAVEVVSLDSEPLRGLVPAEVGKAVQQALADKGVVWHFNETVKAVNQHASSMQVDCASGLKLSADTVLSAVGIKPSVQLAVDAGLTVKRGIVVDQFLQTSAPNVYALGDCCELNEQLKQYVAPLLHAGRCLAKTLTAEPTECVYPVMPVQVKTTVCPVVTVPPVGAEQNWQVETDGVNVKALCYDHSNKLSGFALSGGFVKERMQLIKEM